MSEHGEEIGFLDHCLDPDDLAVVLARLIRNAGGTPHVRCKVEEGHLVAIEVLEGQARLVAVLPCNPVRMDVGTKAAMEALIKAVAHE